MTKTLTSTEADALIITIRSEAAAKHAHLPQYKGHWDGDKWFLVEIARRIKTKLGLAFEKGEIALAKLDDWAHDEIRDGDYVAYSRRNSCNTVLGKKDVRRLEIVSIESPLDYIQVDASGNISYPSPEGFELDIDRVHRSAVRFAPFCNGNIILAVKHAVHEQLSAFRGLRSLHCGLRA